jgi:hypothetical protein
MARGGLGLSSASTTEAKVMRYYRIEIAGKTVWTSHPSGLQHPPDPGALKVEFGLVNAGAATNYANTGSSIVIWGIPRQLISQANMLAGKSIKIYGGMGKGLPLANPSQAGLLIQGTIMQSFANWIGTVMTLNFVLTIPILGDTMPPKGRLLVPVNQPVSASIGWQGHRLRAHSRMS